MKVEKVNYVRRTPKEEYGFLEITLEAQLEKSDDISECLNQLKEIVDTHNNPSESVKKKGAHNGKENSIEKELSQKDDEKSVKEVVAKKKKKSKSSAYDRKNDLHKKLVAEYLDGAYPNWKETKSERAQVVSVKMNGKDFLNDEGEMLEEFKIEFLSHLKKKPKALS
jgi:hypothetical protein